MMRELFGTGPRGREADIDPSRPHQFGEVGVRREKDEVQTGLRKKFRNRNKSAEAPGVEDSVADRKKGFREMAGGTWDRKRFFPGGWMRRGDLWTSGDNQLGRLRGFSREEVDSSPRYRSKIF